MNLIVATDKNWGIGKDGAMPWHISADLKYFKEKTIGKRVIMGRKTLLSFPNSKPLPNRENIVISTNPSYAVEGAEVVNSVDALACYDMGDDTFIIGGGSVYKELLKYCKYAYITKIEEEFECDTYFPNLDELENWKMIDEGELLNENGIDFRFAVYENSDVAEFATEYADDYNDNMPSIDEIDFNKFELLGTVDDEFDADVKISLLRSCSIMAIKRYSSYSAVAKIYCGSSNLGVMIYVEKEKLDEARELLEAPFDISELGE